MLDIQRLITAVVSLTSAAAAGRTFNTGLFIGDSAVISGLQRLRTYSSASGVANDFGTTAPETLAAQLYFAQTPQPQSLMIGRWLRTATSGQNVGGILSATQQMISNFNAISSGGLTIVVDGVTKTLTGISLLGVTNLNAVATAINGVLTGGVVTWNGSQFVVTSNSSGAGVAASGTITLGSNPANNDTLTIGGTTITFVTVLTTGNQVLIGSSAAATAGNLWTFLNGSVDSNLILAGYSLSGSVITVTYKVVGTAGNSYTLAKSSTAITLSAATLAGGAAPSSVSFATAPGSGIDLSALLQLNAAQAQPLVPGYNAETPLAAYAACATASTIWYAGAFACTVFPADSDYLAIASYNEALTTTRLFGVTTQNTAALNSQITSDIGSMILALGLEHSMVVYSSTSPYAVCSAIGRLCGVDFTQSNSTITLMYKQMPEVVAENITDAQANALQAKNVNVFVQYDNNTSLIQYGTVGAVGGYADQTQGVDWFQNAIQTNCFNVLYTTTTKVPQTDAGAVSLTNACGAACNSAINNGLAAPGVWNGPSFGSLVTGQYLKSGFYIYQPSVDTQSQSDRAARKAPPIQIALKLAGAFQEASVYITVNQ